MLTGPVKVYLSDDDPVEEPKEPSGTAKVPLLNVNGSFSKKKLNSGCYVGVYLSMSFATLATIFFLYSIST